jgi:hypothetical protein
MVVNPHSKHRTKHPLRVRSNDPEHRRSELLKHLGLALQLEHSTIPPYLFALCSISDPEDQNFEAARILRSVAVEEMLHMVLVANLINAIHRVDGAGERPQALWLDREGFIPSYPGPLPGSDGSFEVELRPFSREALAIFLQIEKPAEIDVQPIDQTGPAPSYSSIGQFYATIKQEFDDFCDEFGEKELFVGDESRQVGARYYYNGGGEVVEVRDYESSRRALKVIIDEGEGFNRSIFSGDHEAFGEVKDLAHYYKFKQLYSGRFFLPDDGPESEPTGELVPVSFGADAVQPAMPFFDPTDYPEIGALVLDFNRTYWDLLRACEAGFNGRQQELVRAVHLMHTVREKMVTLMRIPIGDSGFTAGPTFAYVPPSN